ncbi:MAG: hypothetical protein ABJA69_09640 [Acidobacteriaceae bacterium]
MTSRRYKVDFVVDISLSAAGLPGLRRRTLHTFLFRGTAITAKSITRGKNLEDQMVAAGYLLPS